MDQLVELEDRLACAVVLRQGAKFPDEGTLGHFLEAERGDDLIDMAFFPDNQLAVDLADWLDQAMLVLRGVVAAVPVFQLGLQVGEARFRSAGAARGCLDSWVAPVL